MLLWCESSIGRKSVKFPALSTVCVAVLCLARDRYSRDDMRNIPDLTLEFVIQLGEAKLFMQNIIREPSNIICNLEVKCEVCF